ncbi:MAG: helix-turn-helix transcriptional regulator [Bacteroidales bacterium]|nr:helix-turn-helix transcriptional regulator [Bacteroidales bacterium]
MGFIFVKFSVTGYLAIGPLFLLYVQSLLKKPFSFRTVHLAHFIPSFVYLIIPERFLDDYFWNYGGFIIIQLYFFVYLLISVYQIRLFYKSIQMVRPGYTIIKWLLCLFTGIFIIWSSVFFKRLNYFPELAAFFSFALYILLFVFFSNINMINGSKKLLPISEGQNAASDAIIRINDLMSHNRPYLDCEFSLSAMSEQLGMSVHTVSYILNNYYKMNFREFINSYRINDIKAKLADRQFDGENIQSLAFEAGFNSLSVFNTEFKKATKKTPTAYRSFYQEMLSDL